MVFDVYGERDLTKITQAASARKLQAHQVKEAVYQQRKIPGMLYLYSDGPTRCCKN